MFERFTRSARDAVVAATQYAAGANAAELREEHLALGVLSHADSPAQHVLSTVGVDATGREELIEDLTALSQRAGVTATDAAALRELGIDVDDVLTRLAEVAGSTKRPRKVLGKRRDKPTRVSWSHGAKRILERALHEAIDLRDMGIDDAHVLLALLGTRGGVAEVLVDRGITYAAVRRAVAMREAG